MNSIRNHNTLQYGWYKQAKEIDHLYTQSDLNWKQIATGLPAAALGLSLYTQQPNKDIEAPKTQIRNVQHNNIKQKNDKKKTQTNTPSFAEVRDFIANWEGKKNKAYKDSKGIWTIGIGFNLERSDADKILRSVGSSKQQVLKGNPLSDEQISNIFKYNYNTAVSDAKSWIPNLEEHPKQVQLIIIDFSFNLGANKLNKFPKAKNAFLQKDYAQAARELETSKWYKDVARRGVNHVKTLKSLVKK